MHETPALTLRLRKKCINLRYTSAYQRKLAHIITACAPFTPINYKSHLHFLLELRICYVNVMVFVQESLTGLHVVTLTTVLHTVKHVKGPQLFYSWLNM